MNNTSHEIVSIIGNRMWAAFARQNNWISSNYYYILWQKVGGNSQIECVTPVAWKFEYFSISKNIYQIV